MFLFVCHSFVPQAFYGKFRRTHTHYHLINDPFWVPADLTEWESMPSTKLTALVTILKYHLEADGRAPLRLKEDFDENDPNALEITPDWQEVTPRPAGSAPDRALLFVSFPSNNALITGVSVSFSTRA